MAITRAVVEAILIKRCGRKMTAASMDGTTVTGSNPDLNDPIGAALRLIGCTVLDISSVSDSDLASVPTEKTDELLDRAEMRTLENIIGNLDVVDISVGVRRQAMSQLAQQTETAIARLTNVINRRYGSSALVDAGSISLGFQEHFEDD